ncbi:MAG: Mur ligase family protein, partial [Dokdonella sp.]
DLLTFGLGRYARSWPLDALPRIDDVEWSQLRTIPTALITGSNGKTTTVRLLAAMLTAQGLRTGFSCTDGVFFDGQRLETGDYSGPGGARTVLRSGEVEAAVLETARGGLLRRGLAIEHADAAIVTNISDDHFGEYGVDDLDGLTEAKLIVARALDADGVLVLNADDAQLRAHAASVTCPLAWFSLDDHHELLAAHRRAGGSTCGVDAERLWLSHGSARADLGLIAAMPLSANGHAAYNISNIAGAALLANALGVSTTTIADVLTRFGSERTDNPGRLERWTFGGITVLMDYAHNPEGLRNLLTIAESIRDGGRMGLLLGQAGNREEPEIRALAATAANFAPDLVVLKDMEGYMRGRAAGEVAHVLRDELLDRGFAADALPVCQNEIDAVRHALSWAREGDLLVLPVHGLKAKGVAGALFDQLDANQWKAGQPLPDPIAAKRSASA